MFILKIGLAALGLVALFFAIKKLSYLKELNEAEMQADEVSDDEAANSEEMDMMSISLGTLEIYPRCPSCGIELLDILLARWYSEGEQRSRHRIQLFMCSACKSVIPGHYNSE